MFASHTLARTKSSRNSPSTQSFLLAAQMLNPGSWTQRDKHSICTWPSEPFQPSTTRLDFQFLLSRDVSLSNLFRLCLGCIQFPFYGQRTRNEERRVSDRVHGSEKGRPSWEQARGRFRDFDETISRDVWLKGKERKFEVMVSRI